MDNRNFLIAFLLVLIPCVGFAQSDSYNLNIYPDVWYNSVDGVRIGGFVLGEMEGEFESGPHRLNAGVWLGTNFPDLPVSYYFSFTEPIRPFTSAVNEANFKVISSIRTGYSEHELSFNKRFQPGFNDLNFRELTFSISLEKHIDRAYRPYPLLWNNDDWKNMVGGKFHLSQLFEIGKFEAKAGYQYNINGSTKVGKVEIKQHMELGELFDVRLRAFVGLANDQAETEYLFGESYRQPIEWLNNGVTRAKGTLPQSLLDDGLFQIAGGANIRGYAVQNFEDLVNGQTYLYSNIQAMNAEFEFPNPVNTMLSKTLAADFVYLRSYLFGDVGRFSSDSFPMRGPSETLISEVDRIRSDAGVGFQFSVNIPNYLGKDRGFALRYEIPFWLSNPANGEKNFKFRNLIGIGAVISL